MGDRTLDGGFTIGRPRHRLDGVEHCAAILSQAARLSLGFLGEAALQRIEALTAFEPRGRERLIASSHGGTVLAFVDWRGHELEFLFVRPDLWNQGIGRALVNAVQDDTGGEVRTMCFKKNAPAQAFYISIGFEKVDTAQGSFFGSVQDNYLLRRSSITTATAVTPGGSGG